MSSNNLPVLSTENLTSAATIKKAAIGGAVAVAVVWFTPWWVIGGAIVGAGVYGYKKLTKN